MIDRWKAGEENDRNCDEQYEYDDTNQNVLVSIYTFPNKSIILTMAQWNKICIQCH